MQQRKTQIIFFDKTESFFESASSDILTLIVGVLLIYFSHGSVLWESVTIGMFIVMLLVRIPFISKKRAHTITNENEFKMLGQVLFDTPATFDLIAHLKDQSEWSLNTFGGGSRLDGVIDHIEKELKEIKQDPDDCSEWADLVLLAFDGAMRADHSPLAIARSIDQKHKKNQARDFPDWRNYSQNEAIEHIKQFKDCYPTGTILRHGSGSTALLRVDSVQPEIGGAKRRYYGRHWGGGSAAAYHMDCEVASVADIEVWRKDVRPD